METLRIQFPNVLIVPKLGRCLLSVSATKKHGIYIFTGDGTDLLTGSKSIPLREVNNLFMLDIDLGEANISAATWHVRLGHVNASNQQILKKECVGVAYKEEARGPHGTCSAHTKNVNHETKRQEQGPPVV